MYDKALEASEKAIQLDPKAAHAYYNLSIVYQKLGRLGQGHCHGEEVRWITILSLDMAHYTLGRDLF